MWDGIQLTALYPANDESPDKMVKMKYFPTMSDLVSFQ